MRLLAFENGGAGFRPDYEALGLLKQRFLKSIIVAFTATADSATKRDKNKIDFVEKGWFWCVDLIALSYR